VTVLPPQVAAVSWWEIAKAAETQNMRMADESTSSPTIPPSHVKVVDTNRS